MGCGWRDPEKKTLNDKVSGHTTSDYENFQKTQDKMENQAHIKEKLEVINNESHQTLRITAVHNTVQVEQQLAKEAFILHQVFNKTDRPPNPQTVRLAPIVFARVRTGLGKARPKDAKVPLNSGASSSIISHDLAKNL